LKTVTLTASRDAAGKIQLLSTNNSNMREKAAKLLHNLEAKLRHV
jgi:hypothetical protein